MPKRDRKPKASGERLRPKGAESKIVFKTIVPKPEPHPDSTPELRTLVPSVWNLASEGQRTAGVLKAFRKREQERQSWELFLFYREKIVDQLSRESEERFRELIDAMKELRNRNEPSMWKIDPKSAERFSGFLTDRQPELRLLAARVMHELGSVGTNIGLTEHFWPSILPGLWDPVPEIRKLMVQSLVWFAGPDDPHRREAFDSVVALLGDADARIRKLVAKSLRSFAGTDHPDHRDALQSVVALLVDPDAEIRERAAQSLRWFAATDHPDHREAFEFTVGLLRNDDVAVRAAAISVMPEFGLDRVSSALDEICKALTDVNPNIRKQACNLLEWLGADAHEAFASLFVRAAEDPEHSVRIAAATAIVTTVRALQKIDPEGTHIDIGPAESELRRGLIEALTEAGPIGSDLRRQLKRSPIDRADEPPPPGLAHIWHELKPTGRDLLQSIYRHRCKGRAQGNAIIEDMCWDGAKNPSSCLRRNLTTVRKQLAAAGIGLKFPMDGSGNVLWR